MAHKLINLIKDIIGDKYIFDQEENLLSVGLDSIQIMNLISILRQDGYDVTFAQFIKNPTINYWRSLLIDNKKLNVNKYEISNSSVDKFPMSPMQHSYWIGSMSNQELGAVAAHIYVEFDANNIDPVILAKSIEALVNRHQMLKVEILNDGYQKFLSKNKTKIFNLIDLRKFSVTAINKKLQAIRQEKSNKNIYQEQNKFIDITLTLLPDFNTRLHVDINMIIADAVSYRILLKELAIIYNNNGIDNLPKLEFSYRDYVLYQLNSKNEKKINSDKNWWTNKLSSFPNPPQLPLKIKSKLEKSSKATRLFYWISDKDSLNIQNNCKHYKVTMAMALLSAFAHAISTHTKESQFFLNIPLFNREKIHHQVDNIVGEFSSSILLEVDLSGNLSIIDTIIKISNTFVDNVSHNNYSALHVLRDLSKQRKTLFLAPVVYTSAINLGELFDTKVTTTFGKPVWIISQGPQVILDAQITEFDGGLLANWDIREDLFLPDVIETMFEIYKKNITQLSGNVNLWLETFNLDEINKQIIARNKFNNIKFNTSLKALHQNFFEYAQSEPDKIALIWEENKIYKSYTYGQLLQLSINFAYFLYENKVKNNSKVALSLPKGHYQVIAILSILYLGATYLPINLQCPIFRKKMMLEVSKANFYIVMHENDIIPDIINTKFLIFNPKVISAKNHQLKLPVPDINQIAYIIFTSGTTGTPKAVAVSHKAVMNTLECVNTIFEVDNQDISLAFSALEFDLSVQDIFGMFNVGGSVFMLNDKNKMDADYWIDLINVYKITQIYAVPSMLDMLLSAKENIKLPSLKLVILGGDKISFDLYLRLLHKSPKCRFAGLGGATETAIHCTYFEVKKFDDKFNCVPYGYPLFNMSCKVVNTQNNNECPNWVIGELLVSGAGLANGYINMPQENAKKFCKQKGITWYRTGDLVRYTNQGIIEYIARADNQVKIRGYRVELGEIEAVLNKLNYIKNSVVFVNNKNGINLIAYVQIYNTPINVNTKLIKDELLKYLPSYMVPENIIIVSQLPITDNAKVDRNKLKEEFIINTSYVSLSSNPSTALEKFIAKKYADFTGVNTVSLEDDFFYLGGDSVLAVKLISHLREELNFQNIEIDDIFDYRTVKLFTNRLKQLEPEKNLLETTAEILLELDLLSDEELLKK